MSFSPQTLSRKPETHWLGFTLVCVLLFLGLFPGLIPYQTTSGGDPVAPFPFRSRSVRTCFAQYPESIVSHTASFAPQFPSRVLSADFGDNSPGRTVFLSWILRTICTSGVWFSSAAHISRHHDSSGGFRVTERYGQDTYRQWDEHYAERIPTGPLPSAPFSGYIRIPLNFTISALFFTIPNSYLEHIKVVSQYHGRLSTVQEIWDQYTCRLVKEYQDFLLIVRLMHFPSSSSEG